MKVEAKQTSLGIYITRPYNFFVNPVPDGRLDIERIFAFQSGGTGLSSTTA
jgi:hypothetical protein